MAVADVFVRDDIITEPVYNRFSVCYEHGCQKVVALSLTLPEWNEITASLQQSLPAASDERAAIATTVSNMEHVVGRRTGTHFDKGGNLKGFGQPGQMDCIDESTNTSRYLDLLQQRGLLRWHRTAERAYRAPFLLDQHWAGQIVELQTDNHYAVDSWHLDNGELPYIQAISDWQKKVPFPGE